MHFLDLSSPRILYMGTPEISAKVLRGLLENKVNIVAVVTNPDKRKGRGDKMEFTPVKEVALEYGLPVFQPERIKEDNAFLKDLDLDAILTMAYGQIVPEAVLSCPKIGAFNLHGSLLPKYRGAAPMQRCLIDNEPVTGVTLMEMVKAMDAGRMYAKKEFAVEAEDNYTSISEKVALASIELTLSSLLGVLNGENQGEPQDEAKVTYAAKILPEEEHLDLSLPSIKLLGYIRALSLTPGGYLFLGEKKLKVFQAKKTSEDKKGELGRIFLDKKGIFVQASDGIISLDSVQIEGKKRMDGRSFANGMRQIDGEILK